MKKQILALGLVLVLCVGLLPNSVLAITGNSTDAEEELVLETEETTDVEIVVENPEESPSDESGETVAAAELAEEEAEEPSDDADLTQEEQEEDDEGLTEESEEIPASETEEQETTDTDVDTEETVAAQPKEQKFPVDSISDFSVVWEDEDGESVYRWERKDGVTAKDNSDGETLSALDAGTYEVQVSFTDEAEDAALEAGCLYTLQLDWPTGDGADAAIDGEKNDIVYDDDSMVLFTWTVNDAGLLSLTVEQRSDEDKFEGSLDFSVCLTGNGEDGESEEPEDSVPMLLADSVDDEDYQVYSADGSIEIIDERTGDVFIAKITDSPTNTMLSLSSPSIKLYNNDANGGLVTGETMAGRLYFVPFGYEDDPDHANWQQVSALMLDGASRLSDGTYEVRAVNSDGEAYDLTTGSLYLRNTTIVSARADIWPSQTNTLCYLDASGAYQQELLEAETVSALAQTFYYPGHENDVINLADLTNGQADHFYYGNLENGVSGLTQCTQAKVIAEEEGIATYYYLYPLDKNGEVVRLVNGTNLYMAYDVLYSFDVELDNIVCEHTEDNGDIYFWVGDTYYVDKYHNMGNTAGSYTNNTAASNLNAEDIGVWAQLGNIREPLINQMIARGMTDAAAFATYADVPYSALASEGVTQNILDKIDKTYNYGIAGPFSADSDDAENGTGIGTETVRVTGYLGDRMTATDAFGNPMIYLFREDTELHTDWINMGLHSSEGGTRAWWYWIKDYYQLSNYDDTLEYVQIEENADGEIRLYADELGEDHLGHEYDVWNLDLYTKRDSVVKTDMMNNQEKYTEQGIAFSDNLGLPCHIQLRTDSSIETTIDGVVYTGALELLYEKDASGEEVANPTTGSISPYIWYYIPITDGNGHATGEYYCARSNEQEAECFYFNDENSSAAENLVYIPAESMFNAGDPGVTPDEVNVSELDGDAVYIYVQFALIGTLISGSGDVIAFTEEDPYIYSGWLTSQQLQEGYLTCPNNRGYDVIVSVADALAKNYDTTTETILYKVWDDDNNAYDSRGNVTEIEVTLERSEDGEVWVPVYNTEGDEISGLRTFTIVPPEDDDGNPDYSSNQWSLHLTEDDLPLTYTNAEGQESYYQYRIATESYADGESTDAGFDYNTVLVGTTLSNVMERDSDYISGQKLWKTGDGEDLDPDLIPATTVTIVLLQDGIYYDRMIVTSQAVTDDDGNIISEPWAFEFKDLPMWNGTDRYTYTLAEMNEDGTYVADGDSVLVGEDWFQVDIDTDDEGNTYFSNSGFPDSKKEVDVDGDGAYEDDGTSVQVGDQLDYRINFYNDYSFDVNLTITDEIDVGLTYVEGSAVAVYEDGTEEPGTYDAATRTITWTFEDLPSGTHGYLYYSAVVNENALEKNDVENHAHIVIDTVGLEFDTNETNNPVLYKDVDIDASDGLDYGDSEKIVSVDDTLTYRIDFENPDDDPATVTITDELDAGLDYVEGSAKAYDADGVSLTYTATYDASTRTITWVITEMEAHTRGSVTFEATVNSDAERKNEVENTATVQVGTHPAKETNTVWNPLGEHKDVDVDGDGVYDDGDIGVRVGDTLSYKLTYMNDVEGGGPATVTITDTLDEGLTYVEGSASDGGTYDEATRTITWVIENVPENTGGYVTFEVTVNENALIRNEVENKATIRIGDEPGIVVETNPSYNPVLHKDVDIDPEDGLDYGDSGRVVEVGDTLTYKVDYDNPYDDPATVTIRDPLDVGLTYVEDSAAAWVYVQDADGNLQYDTDGNALTRQVSDVTVSYDETTRTITWVIAAVEAHTNGYVTFEATVNETAENKNEVDDTASLQVGDGPEQETNTVWNPLGEHKDVDADGDGVYGDEGAGVRIGDTLTYVIQYVNDDEEGNPAKVTITDVLDEGLTYVEGSASDGGTYDEATRTITWVIENVAAQTGGTVTFEATVNENAYEKNEVENTGRIVYNDDPDTEVETNPVYNPVPQKDVDADGDGELGDSGMHVEVGDTLTYEVFYENPDDERADVVITDTLDEGLTYVEGSASNRGTYDEATRTITWTISNVRAHAVGSVTFEATVNENAIVSNMVENTATVQVGDHPAQETDRVYNPLEPQKDIDADGDGNYGDDGMAVRVGDTVTYVISYFNAQEESATVTITDKLDEGLTFVSASDGGTYNEDTRVIVWTLDYVPACTGGSVTFEAVVNEDALTDNEIDNRATVRVGNDPSTETNPVVNPVPYKDVDIDGADGLDYGDSGRMVEVGDTLTYRIDYENPGDEAADVTITDVLDEGLTYVSSSDDGRYNMLNRTITWNIRDVDAHTNGSVTFTVTVNENALEKNEVDNTATIQVGDYPEQQTEPVYNPLQQKDVDADGDGVYGDGGVSVRVGDTLTYSISYINVQKTAADVIITDVLDDGLTFVSASDGGAYDAATRTVTWVIPDVASNAGGSVTLTVTVNENARGTNEVRNTASVQVGDEPAEETEPVYNPVIHKDVDSDGDGAYGDNGIFVLVGDTLTYEIEYENPDDEPADVVITDTLDEGLDFISASDGGSYDSRTRTVSWEIEGVAAHTNGSVTFTATVNEDARIDNEVENTATVTVGEHPGRDTNTVYNPDPDKEVDVEESDGLDFGDDGALVEVGQNLTYRIIYENPYDEAQTVTIRDTLDQGLTFVSASDGGTYNETSRTITWVLEGVQPHANGSVTFTARVNENAVTNNVIENVATEQIGDLPEQETSHTWNPLYEPVKSVDTDGNGDFADDGANVRTGDTLTYQVQFYNYRDEAVTVTVTDTLDEALDFVSASDGGIYDEASRTIYWAIGDVPAHSYGAVTFDATVNSRAVVQGTIPNTATVMIGNDRVMQTNTVTNTTRGSITTVGRGPKTGDGNGTQLYWIIALMALAALGAYSVYDDLRKQKKRK